ncbi:membrane lipoprotein lipid attachment site-containing protein [Sutcliffiella horikoshii]|uniref:membrane lipoprotein lipid attachment site-containing protein n=1 Tax=Sutcliffiella horikoshii TaxID=79883 RepID=UPI0007D08E35|nr:membrane lipoprotein lipid attachment site-containing protein [Sutcliffiella horikoshii]MCM3619213.1 membrane lipoprotein lipid attachment site-containing protein [Sutcliffiella horikoshii]
MKKLLVAFCFLSLLTACSSSSDTTEEIIIVDTPDTKEHSSENPDNAKDGTLYMKEKNEDE